MRDFLKTWALIALILAGIVAALYVFFEYVWTVLCEIVKRIALLPLPILLLSGFVIATAVIAGIVHKGEDSDA